MNARVLRFSVLAAVFLFPMIGYSQGALDQRIGELSQQIAGEMTQYQKTTIAVVEFSDLQGNVTDFGRYLAEELVTRLFQTGKFKVIERQLLNKVVHEQKLSLTGLVDPSSAKQLGKILGVDAIVSGTITDLAQSLKVNARLISTETGEIFAVASVEIFKDESVMKLMATGVSSQGANPVVASPEPAANVPASSQSGVTIGDFTFRGVSARRTDNGVDCAVSFLNTGQDQKSLDIYGSCCLYSTTYMYDDLGNQYSVNVMVGQQKTSSHFSQDFVPNLPVIVHFLSQTEVSSQAKSITMTIIAQPIKGLITVRNIPITK